MFNYIFIQILIFLGHNHYLVNCVFINLLTVHYSLVYCAQSGQVRSWDRIVAINGEPVEEYDTALAKLTNCHPCAHLRLARTRSSAGGEASELSALVITDLPR